VFDPNDHAVAVDVVNLEGGRLADPPSGTKTLVIAARLRSLGTASKKRTISSPLSTTGSFFGCLALIIRSKRLWPIQRHPEGNLPLGSAGRGRTIRRRDPLDRLPAWLLFASEGVVTSVPSASSDPPPARLSMPANSASWRSGLAKPANFGAYLRPLRAIPWVVYAKRPFGGPEQVLDYLNRYTHRVAMPGSCRGLVSRLVFRSLQNRRSGWRP
jgi:hypothetical protein